MLGLRDVDDIVNEAVPNGLELREVVDMPANNLSLMPGEGAGCGEETNGTGCTAKPAAVVRSARQKAKPSRTAH